MRILFCNASPSRAADGNKVRRKRLKDLARRKNDPVVRKFVFLTNYIAITLTLNYIILLLYIKITVQEFFVNGKALLKFFFQSSGTGVIKIKGKQRVFKKC